MTKPKPALNSHRRLRTLTGATAYARYQASKLQHKDSDLLYVAGYVPRCILPAVSRFSYSPTQVVYRTAPADMRNSECVVIVQVHHNEWQVWVMSPESVTSEAEAEAYHLAHVKAGAK